MQESRLFKILYYLLDKGSATAAELAERFEVSVRTIYRDIDALSSAGIPVYTEAGRNGGIHLLNDSILDKTIISEPEKQEILSALQGLSVMSNEYKKDTFEKLSALFQVSSVNWLEVDFSRWGIPSQDNQKFETIKTAILHNRCLKIFYANSSGKADERVVQPLKLFYKSEDWYLKAYCRFKQDFRLFKLNRILKWELLEEPFEPMIFPEVTDNGQQIYDQVTLRFPKEIAYRVYDEFDVTQIKSEKNGTFTVTANMTVDDWLIGYLLSFGTQIEIMKPMHLKKRISAKAKEIYEKHKT
ncbi:MAG: YafY family protein [Lachnospiraceae bacterium]|nr:YafY family protein [Lachnospiraceae bacterium]